MDKKRKKREKTAENTASLLSMFEGRSTETDPFGSYTGVPENRYEEPVQDADDL